METYLINQETGGLSIGTDNSVDLYIKTGGNVGIGTTVPDTSLVVQKTSVGGVSYPLQLFNPSNASTGVGSGVVSISS